MKFSFFAALFFLVKSKTWLYYNVIRPQGRTTVGIYSWVRRQQKVVCKKVLTKVEDKIRFLILRNLEL